LDAKIICEDKKIGYKNIIISYKIYKKFKFNKVFEFFYHMKEETNFHIISCACTGLEPVSPHIKRIIEYDQTGKLF
jgi:hypothetical protein